MTYENVRIQHGNFAVDRAGTDFFSMDHDNQRLVKKSAAGAVLFSFFLDMFILEVQSLQFDGYYYWTLERQGTAGFRVRKWEIGTDDLVRVVDELSFASGLVNRYDTYALAVEAYQDTLDNIVVAGQSVFDVVEGDFIRPGDVLVIGPSTAVGFEGEYAHTTVATKVGKTVTVTPPATISFSPNDIICFTRSLFVFSDAAPSGLTGALYKLRYTDGFHLALSVSNMFWGVRASTFFQGKVLFVRGGEIIWLNPDSLEIYRSQAIDNLDQYHAVHRTTYDLTGFSNMIYRLEREHIYWNVGYSRYDTEDWSPLYNYNTSPVVPEVYFVAVKAEPPILHKYVSGVPAVDTKSLITVTVLDQFHSPVYNRVVNLTSTGGALSPIQGTTDTNGQIRSEYTSNAFAGDVTIGATVT